jgi:hypothetical protein
MSAGFFRRRNFVRPYVLTRGRTSSSFGTLALHAPIVALVTPEQLPKRATPEERRIVELTQTPLSLAEVAARMSTPVGVVRVLVGDLAERGCVQARPVAEEDDHRDVKLLERLLEGIRAL